VRGKKTSKKAYSMKAGGLSQLKGFELGEIKYNVGH